MKSVWKYPLAVTDRCVIEMPEGAQPLTVQMQGGAPYIWAIADTTQSPVPHLFRIVGTGHSLRDNTGRYVGTFQMLNGTLVFHVFYEGKSAEVPV